MSTIAELKKRLDAVITGAWLHLTLICPVGHVFALAQAVH